MVISVKTGGSSKNVAQIALLDVQMFYGLQRRLGETDTFTIDNKFERVSSHSKDIRARGSRFKHC